VSSVPPEGSDPRDAGDLPVAGDPSAAGDQPAVDQPPEADDNRLIAERRAKLAAWRHKALAFPNDFRRDALAAQLLTTYTDRDSAWLEAHPVQVRVGGRMMFKRVMGKASFAKIADRSGQIQLFLQHGTLGDSYEQFKGWDVGDFLGAEGVLFRTRTGELSVRVERLVLLTKSLRPLPDKWHGLADTELRYRQRYVDLIMNQASREVFRTRTRVLRYLRDYLDALDFMEVETPMMQPIPGGAAARPFKTHHNALDQDMYLRIAPELYLKRLIVGGLERVYEINRNFRNEGLSTQHNPEFTMLELYWAYTDYQELMELVERLLHGLADSLLGSRRVNYQGREYDLARPFTRITVEQAILQHNPSLERAQLRDVPYLRRVCERLDILFKAHDGAGKLQIEIFEKTAEHTLFDPTFVTAYPAEVSPLSRANDADPFLTDRFEFFLAGRELANGFSELNDPEDQAARFHAQAARKDSGDDEAMHYDADYIRALEYGMPPTAGLGVGVDRLVMFFTDSASIRDVLLFPQLRSQI
jgi:lysyl-tRNA synthetase class 2